MLRVNNDIMDIFAALFTNLIPLYILIALGWIAGRYFSVERQSLGSLGIYILMPIVAFGFVAGLEFQPEYALLPLIVFALFTGVTLVFYAIGKRIFPDNRANLMAMCAGSGNTGYFGLPLVLLLFDPQWIAVYIFAMMGGSIYEATVMFYIANRGKFDARQSLMKLLKFPTLYTIAAALIVNASGTQLPAQFTTYWEYAKGAYILIGMMIIGVSLSKAEKLVIGPRFLSLVFLGKFIVWPLSALALVWLDRSIFGLFSPEIHRLLIVMSIVPPAANIAAFAAQLDMRPEKAATTILLGTVFALFYIPFIIVLTGFW